MTTPTPPTLIIGLGQVGQALAEALVALGVPVTGTTRDPHKALQLRERGIPTALADLGRPDELAHLCPPGGAVVHTAPPLVDGGHTDLGARNVVRAVAPARPRALVYLSTTGVYREREGGLVDEAGAVDAADPRAAPRLDAEATYLAAAGDLGATGVVFRLAGIYGRGRGLAERLRAGRVRLWGGGHQILNRIHVEDIVRFVLAALTAPPERSGIYNLADDAPTSLRDHAFGLADRLGLPRPPEAPAEEAPSPTLLGSKRVDNRKAKSAFGLTLAYPSWREGLAAEQASPEGGRPGPGS